MNDEQNHNTQQGTDSHGGQPTGSDSASDCGCQPNESKESKEAAKAADEAQAASGQHVYPQVTFTTFVLSLSSSSMVHLGEVPDPESGATQQNLPLAKHTIDILAMLKEKTANCLDAEETRLLDGVLYELRMIYVMKNK